jgi:hypothetical protein
MRIWELAVERMKAEVEVEAASRLEQTKREILDRLGRQFAELMRTSPRDLDEYVQTLPLERQAIVAAVHEQSMKSTKKRPQKGQTGRERIPPNPEALKAMIARLSESGADIAAMPVLADGCFLYRGQMYILGNAIQIATRNEGNCIQGVVASVTVAEIDISFKDGTIITVSREDLAAGTVVLIPAE